MKAFFISVPHSGEKLPDEVSWLSHLEEPILMCDVDRFVDRLYEPTIRSLKIPHVIAEWHRYVVDLNRLPEDVDEDSVIGSANKSGTHTTGLHWVKTTKGHQLMKEAISQELHKFLVDNYFLHFHQQVQEAYQKFFNDGADKVFHLDAHSMPSKGTSAHRDPGELRAEIVISDSDGKSCEGSYLDLVVESYKAAGFGVKVNWPYKGGRITQTYGHPGRGQHAIQVEMNRQIYMNEETKKIKQAESIDVQKRVQLAVERILNELPAYK